ncbi:MAG: hypothetical protein Q9191_005171 [Dirinaria sp. TL-2023a]
MAQALTTMSVEYENSSFESEVVLSFDLAASPSENTSMLQGFQEEFAEDPVAASDESFMLDNLEESEDHSGAESFEEDTLDESAGYGESESWTTWSNEEVPTNCAADGWDAACGEVDVPLPTPERIFPSWSSPLPTSPEPLQIDSVTIDGHPFLTAFFEQTRAMDIPFATSHRLASFLMHLVEECCFDFVQRVYPDELPDVGFEANPDRLERLPVTSGDQIEVQQWAMPVSRCLRRLQFEAGSNDNTTCNVRDLTPIRLLGVHSWAVYNTRYIKQVVGLVALLKDECRLSKIERVLQVLYQRQQPPSETAPVISAEDNRAVDIALGLVPSPATTTNQLLCRVQDIVEKSCFDFWSARQPEWLLERGWSGNAWVGSSPSTVDGTGWDCPERVELNVWTNMGWHFPEFSSTKDPLARERKRYYPARWYLFDLLRSMRRLRNNAAHKGIGLREQDIGGLEKLLTDASELATLLGDPVATAQIRALVAQAAPVTQLILAREAAERELERRWNEEWQILGSIEVWDYTDLLDHCHGFCLHVFPAAVADEERTGRWNKECQSLLSIELWNYTDLLDHCYGFCLHVFPAVEADEERIRRWNNECQSLLSIDLWDYTDLLDHCNGFVLRFLGEMVQPPPPWEIFWWEWQSLASMRLWDYTDLLDHCDEYILDFLLVPPSPEFFHWRWYASLDEKRWYGDDCCSQYPPLDVDSCLPHYPPFTPEELQMPSLTFMPIWRDNRTTGAALINPIGSI